LPLEPWTGVLHRQQPLRDTGYGALLHSTRTPSCCARNESSSFTFAELIMDEPRSRQLARCPAQVREYTLGAES
jgi:hypothetical protein